ncbi:MAG: NAD+ synthase, partial [Fibrobacter sp.]|nr:NAD+ synthase [Fibrobacter sp.]
NKAKHPDLIVFPELFLQGSSPKDLFERESFLDKSKHVIKKICDLTKTYLPNTGVLTGSSFSPKSEYGDSCAKLYNSALLIYNGEITFCQNKRYLDSCDTSDETRYFNSPDTLNVFPFKGEILGINVCNDTWDINKIDEKHDSIGELVRDGATIVINIAASPFCIGKDKLRYSRMRNNAVKHSVPVVYVNMVGGNDELIFDGNSMFFDNNGDLRALLPSFEEAVVEVDTKDPAPVIEFSGLGRMESVHDALVLGIRDYARKCGFKKVILGLSGGIDSALTAALAVDALGAENVFGITMPTRYSSEGSCKDSEKLAKNLNIQISTIPIEGIYSTFLNALDPLFKDTKPCIAEENLQARLRGTLLMTVSNKFGHLLLSTGNKSETAVGYGTLYGDMCGGLAVIADLPKVMVYELAEYINRNGEIIPEETIAKAPSAELRYGQKDQDTLPPYPVLDAILERLIERGWSREEIIKDGFDSKTVDWVINAVVRNEYKRHQAPVVLKVSSKAFGSGRRFPIASKYAYTI